MMMSVSKLAIILTRCGCRGVNSPKKLVGLSVYITRLGEYPYSNIWWNIWSNLALIHSNQMSIDDIQIKSNEVLLFKLFDFANTGGAWSCMSSLVVLRMRRISNHFSMRRSSLPMLGRMILKIWNSFHLSSMLHSLPRCLHSFSGNYL
jgi:hypothetical protein